MPSIDTVLKNLERVGREDRVETVRAVLRGEAPHRVSAPVKVRANKNSKKTAPNGEKFHVRIIGSTGGVARDGGVVPISAWENGGLARFEQNPVIQFAHDYKKPPIGKSVYNELRHTDRHLMQWWLFHEENEESRLMKRLFERGFMRAASVGFIIHEIYFPTEKEAEALQNELGTSDEIWWVAKRAELLETSAVPVPADPGALVALQHAITNGRAYGLDIAPLEHLRSLCDAGDSTACERTNMPPVNQPADTGTDEELTEEQREAEQKAAQEAAEAQAKLIRDAVSEAIKPLQERLDKLEAARSDDNEYLDEDLDEELDEDLDEDLEDDLDEDDLDEDDLDEDELDRGVDDDESDDDEDMVEVEVREGESLDDAITRIAEEKLSQLRGAPQRRKNS